MNVIFKIHVAPYKRTINFILISDTQLLTNRLLISILTKVPCIAMCESFKNYQTIRLFQTECEGGGESTKCLDNKIRGTPTNIVAFFFNSYFRMNGRCVIFYILIYIFYYITHQKCMMQISYMIFKNCQEIPHTIYKIYVLQHICKKANA